MYVFSREENGHTLGMQAVLIHTGIIVDALRRSYNLCFLGILGPLKASILAGSITTTLESAPAIHHKLPIIKT